MRHLAILLTMLATPIAAQTQTVVPAGFGYDKFPGEAVTEWPFSRLYYRASQIVLARAVGFTRGTVTQLEWRRGLGATTFVAASRQTVIRLGHTTHTPLTMPSQFSRVATGGLAEVFRGSVSLPTAPGNRPNHPWSVVVKLDRPWPYDSSKGNLVLDVECATNVNSRWRRDARMVTTTGRPGRSRELGRGCGLSTLANVSTLIPGQTLRIIVQSARSFSALQFLGFRNTSPFPIDLTSVGAPGCRLYTEPSLTQPVAMQREPHGGTIGVAMWPLPNVPALRGQRFNTQSLAAGNNRLGLVFSNGLELQLGDPSRPWVTRELTSPTRTDTGRLSSVELGSIVRITTR